MINYRKILPLILIVLGSCSIEKQEIKVAPPVDQKSVIQKKEKTQIVLNLKPLPMQTPTLKEMESFQGQKEGTDVLVSLSFDNIDLKKALLALGKATGYNVIVPPDVEGRVSIELKGESLKDSLNSLLKPFGYSYKIDAKNIYVISKETKVFHINLPQTKRQFSSSIEASIGGSSEGTGSTTTTTSTATMSIGNSYDLDIWNNIKNSIDVIVKNDKTASYSVEPISGTVIVTAKPETLKRVKEFIDTINRISDRQVLIEAKIVEVKLDKRNELGINWKYLTFSNFLGSGGEYNTISFNSGAPEGKPFQLSIVKVNNTFYGLLGILSQFGKVNVLSSPRILAMNGQPAMIKVGRDYLAIYRTQTTSTTSTGSQTATTLTTEEVTTNSILTEGVVLTIIPKIDDKGNIILNISPAISSLDSPLITGSTGVTTDFINKVYSVNIRQLNTVVRVKNGQTVILGGLIAKSKSKEKEGVPILQDIPLLGNAFKSTSTISSKTELVIMLTPYVESSK
ncbi:type II secretion system protein GspD [Desulfurobacterium thermolithotrophum]|uniref:type II secretion system protein GspD n=1 Tax=Desulfurobacterium thermolithotrophum TaxID=64160 RepID=UPI0013D6E56E|nr:secretin and TonB N-terminal domain-containing protein [Desulfurobacterium thermolithotrophum]